MATKALVECQIAAVKQLDDHKSDATTIGRAVASFCVRESQALFSTITRGQSEGRIRALRERWAVDQVQSGTNIVLSMRAQSQKSL